MNNITNPCLKTQVLNDSENLERDLGEIKLVVLLPANQRVVLTVNRLTGYESVFRTITDGVKFSESADGELTDTYTMDSSKSMAEVYVANTSMEAKKAIIFVSDKYYFSRLLWNISAASAGARIYTETYKGESSEWLSGIERLTSATNSTPIVGELHDLIGMYGATTLLIDTDKPSTTEEWGVFVNVLNFDFNSLVSGDIVKLGKCINLTNLAFGNSHCSGTIESLIQAMRANGRTTGSMTGNSINNSDVTFNGSTANAKGTVSWTVSTITMNGITIDA